MSLNFDGSDATKKVCLQVKRVFDACRKEISIENRVVRVSNVNPANPTLSLTFRGARSSATTALIENLTVTPLECGKLARYRGNAIVPLTVFYTDAGGVNGSGSGCVSVPFDIALCLPHNSIIPYTIEAMVSAQSSIGTFSGTQGNDYLFTMNICIFLIIKVVMESEIIVPSYGYAVIPECCDFSGSVCDRFFSQPIFPE